jgi:hypothetical protein
MEDMAETFLLRGEIVVETSFVLLDGAVVARMQKFSGRDFRSWWPFRKEREV